MKIAYIVVWRDARGPSGVLRKVCTQIRTWMAQGHEPILYLLSQDEVLWSGLGDVPTALFPYRSLGDRLEAAGDVTSSILQRRPDAVYLRFSTWYPAWERLASEVPTFVEANSNDLSQGALTRNLWRHTLHRLTRGRLLGRAAGIVCVSREIEELLRQFGRPTCTIGNGVDLDSYALQPPAQNHQPVLVFLADRDVDGSCSSWQGLDKVIELADLLPDLSLCIVGPDLASVGASAPENVRAYGFLDRDHYEALLASSDVGIGTLALYRKGMKEASPLKVREYLACGLPVVAGYADTDFPGEHPFILRIPNTPDNVQRTAAEIRRFALRWQGRRVSRTEVAHLDAATKESQRLAFIADVLSTCHARRNSGVSAVRHVEVRKRSAGRDSWRA